MTWVESRGSEANPAHRPGVAIPTPWGEFRAHAYERPSGHVYIALVRGEVASEDSVLVRVHSECLTGDTLGSLRCDCGLQLRLALRAIAAEGRGVLVYATGHEARGVGLVNKLRAYAQQDAGLDTVDANVRLGLPVDARTYDDAAQVLHGLGVRSVRLLTNNPAKVLGLTTMGVEVTATVPLPTAPHARNLDYLRTKQRRLGHQEPVGDAVGAARRASEAVDVSPLLGAVRPLPRRPYVVLKFAQTLDGRIATSTGDARWISGEAERRISHALRAACDAVLVGIGTVLQDDPQLTVRMVDGANPQRIVLDSALRVPDGARVLDGAAATTVLTTAGAELRRAERLRSRGVGVRAVPEGPGGIDLPAALERLRADGVRSVLVEGGSRVITGLLAAGLVDRVVVGVAPTIIGRGTDAVGGLGVTEVAAGIRLVNRVVHVLDDDIVLAWDVALPG